MPSSSFWSPVTTAIRSRVDLLLFNEVLQQNLLRDLLAFLLSLKQDDGSNVCRVLCGEVRQIAGA